MIRVGSQVLVEDPPKWILDYARRLRIPNPQRAQALRFGSVYAASRHPKWVSGCTIQDSGDVIIPRAAYYADVHDMVEEDVEVCTVTTDVEYPDPLLEMLPHQEEAMKAFMSHVNDCDAQERPIDTTIVMATSSGKTVLGMYLAYLCTEKTLVVVHSQEVEKAWLKDSEKMFGFKKKDIGRIRGKKITIGEQFTIGSVQTLMNLKPSLWRDEFGMVIFDELHRHAATCFSRVAERARANVRVGITASDTRKDGRMPVIRWHLGKNCHKDTTPRNSVPLHFHGVITGVSVSPTKVNTVDIEVISGEPPVEEEYVWGDVCTKLSYSEERNDKIVFLIKYIIENHRGDILLPVNRKEHAYELVDRLISEGISAVALTGDITGNKREQVYTDICNSEYKVTVGMLQIVSDGASNPYWEHAVNVVPFSDRKTAEQLKGRPIRKRKGKKKAHFWDLIDDVDMLRNMATTRYRGLRNHIVSACWHEILKTDEDKFTLVRKE
ncbi:MAG: hypothetical protein GF334_12415 [Candidatus Altiarchaeales archaeon]|nr:hypothetical protein [Candidatus Altiarchaeales archaeon]